MSMRILYDHQAFTMQNYGGISRYFFELTRQFQENPQLNLSGSLIFSNNEFIKKNKIFRSISFLKSVSDFQKKIEVMNLLNEMNSWATFKRNNFDLFHPTYYDPYYLRIKSNKPVIITFHDLIHEKFIQSDSRTLANKKTVLNRADKIIAVSQNSKNDLMEYYNIPERRITVVHLASSIAIQNGQVNEIPKKNYLLYVGNRNHYKNFIFFVKAIAPLLVKEPALSLYCAGGGKFTRDEIKAFYQLKIENKIVSHSGSDENLAKMYSNAIAFLFPSLYEGFGLPLVEAMSCGCPIGASQTSSLPEVAKDAALYFNPSDKDSILSVAESLVYKADVRSALKEKGLSRVQDFSWQKTAAHTQDVYSSVL